MNDYVENFNNKLDLPSSSIKLSSGDDSIPKNDVFCGRN